MTEVAEQLPHFERAILAAKDAARALESLTPASDRKSRLERERLRMEVRRAALWCERIVAQGRSGARRYDLLDAARAARRAASGT